MLRWIRRIIRKWLLEDQAAPATIDVMVAGRIRTMAIVKAVGAKLWVQDGTDSMLVGAADAVDRAAFQAAWESRSKTQGYTLTWEDGERFTKGDL